MPIFEIPVDVKAEYFPMINDMLRMGTIQVIIQIMFCVSNPVENPFWSPIFMQTILFMLIGILAYWLVFRHTVSFVSPSEEVNRIDDTNVGLLEVNDSRTDSV